MERSIRRPATRVWRQQVNRLAPDPSDPRKLYKPDDFDFRLRPDYAAVDAGIRLPNVNDDFTGGAPDIGAYATGRPLRHYGPRP